ncbi:MAG TPA: efflux RND transporter periplasmic adaptor subunit [Candidatus Polarisedimenticolaceae bacterium]|nr:efflux RND transporter periplasmic adaptor subunit [Candidatus Polarisedimenticolaceae bacterium]
MSVRSIVGLGAILVVVAGLAVPRLIDGRAGGSRPAPSAAAPTRLAVEVLEVEPRRMAERLATTGTVRANESVDLVSEIAGVVRTIHFDEGATVEQGELLVEIDDTELQAQRDRVLYRLRLAENREARQRELREQGVVSEQDYDVADNELNVLRADLRLIEAELAKAAIRAPFSGVVGLRYVSTGSLVSRDTLIATLQDLDPAKIDFTLPEKYAGRVGAGDPVEFRVRGSDRVHTARIYAVEPRIVAETRSLLLRATTANDERALLPGAFADVTLAVDEVADAIVVPSLAVVPELGGKKVFVVENGRAEARRVETGIRTDTEIQITAGLRPGERVIVSAIQRLEPGLPVDELPGATGAAAAR